MRSLSSLEIARAGFAPGYLDLSLAGNGEFRLTLAPDIEGRRGDRPPGDHLAVRRTVLAFGQEQTSAAVSSAAAWDGWGATSWNWPQYLHAPVVTAKAMPTSGFRFSTASGQSQTRVAALAVLCVDSLRPSRPPG